MERRWLAVGLTVMGLFGAPGGTRAQETNDSVYMGEIVVTGSRREMLLRDTADIVQVIDRREIEAMLPSSTGELIEYATGIAVETGTGSGLPSRSVVSINGLPPTYTLVLVDGVRLITEHIHSGQNLEFIPPGSIERIEVVRGASSAQYGSDAIGGIVNIITRKCADVPLANIRATAGSYDTYEGAAGFLMPVSRNVRFSTFMNWAQSDGVPVKAPAHRVDNMGYKRLNSLSRLAADVGDDTTLFAWLNWVENQMDWRDDTADSTLITPVFGLDRTLTPSLDLHAQVSYSDWDAEVNGEKNQLWEPEVHTAWRIGNEHTLTTGVDFKHNEFERRAVDAREQTAGGLFFQDDWVANERFTMMTALRYDKVEDVDGAVSPKVSVMFAPVERVRMRASIGRGFRAPTLQELYEEGYGHGGRAYRFGNPDLDPEYSTTYTCGLELQPAEAVQLMLYGFYSDLDDMIVPVYRGAWDEDPTIDVWERTNINNAQVYGAEANVAVQLCDCVRIEGGYTYTDNEDKDTGRQLPYSPGSSAYGKLLLSQPVAGNIKATGFVGIRSAFDREAWNWKPASGAAVDDPAGLTTPLEDYTKLDAGVTLSFGDIYEAFVKVENILGEDIENLDDVFTVIDGEPVVFVGLNYNLPFSK